MYQGDPHKFVFTHVWEGKVKDLPGYICEHLEGGLEVSLLGSLYNIHGHYRATIQAVSVDGIEIKSILNDDALNDLGEFLVEKYHEQKDESTELRSRCGLGQLG